MRLVQVKGKWYVNRCSGSGVQGKESTCPEFLEFCKIHQHTGGCDCPLVNNQLGVNLFGSEEASTEISEDVAMAFLRNCK